MRGQIDRKIHGYIRNTFERDCETDSMEVSSYWLFLSQYSNKVIKNILGRQTEGLWYKRYYQLKGGVGQRSALQDRHIMFLFKPKQESSESHKKINKYILKILLCFSFLIGLILH